MDSYIVTEGTKMADQSHPDDVQIIAGLNRDDERSATDLILKYRKQLMAFLEFGMRVPWDQAGEMLNDVFYKVIRERSLIRPGTDKLGPLLYKCCENAAKDWHRKRKREDEAFSEVVKELSEQGEIYDSQIEPPSKFPEPHIYLMSQALSGLDPMYREPVQMRLLQGCPFNEIAERLEEKEGTVRQRYHRGFNYLKERYLNLLDNQPTEIQVKIRKRLRLGGEENT